MQMAIYDRFDLFKTNVVKRDLYTSYASSRMIEFIFKCNMDLSKATRLVGTQSHVESNVVDLYRKRKQYKSRRVEVLVYNNGYYLLNGHHTYIAWVLDNCPCSLKVRLVEFKR